MERFFTTRPTQFNYGCQRSFFETLLDAKPPLHELCEHIRLSTKWRLFGVFLKLDKKCSE